MNSKNEKLVREFVRKTFIKKNVARAKKCYVARAKS